ncbi:EamA family transporter [Candidatus Bipolaricaulota bacterium]|nr:EamA family transporter [Candidatus Bipolaricaulota bacterium]
MNRSFEERVGSWLVLLAATCWSILGIVGRMAFASGMGPQTLVFSRVVVAVVLLGAGMLAVRPRLLRVRACDLRILIPIGAIVALNYSTYYQSVLHLGVAVSIAVFYVFPALTAIAAWLMLGERIGAKIAVALVIAVFGCALVSGLLSTGVHVSALGIVFALVSATSYAGYAVLIRRAVRRRTPAWLLFYSLLFALPGLAVATLLAGEPLLPQPGEGWLYVGVLAIVPTLAGYALYAHGLRRLPAARAAILATMEPVLATVWAVVFLSERLTGGQSVGFALVLTSAWLAYRGHGKGRRV